ncbi:uncharacterized protein METZ01_LOCUS176940, partial [marine metagenome]
MKVLFSIFIFLFSISLSLEAIASHPSHGGTRYWVGTVDGASFSDDANWSRWPGSSALSWIAPNSRKQAIFTIHSLVNAKLFSNAVVKKLTTWNDYSGTIDLNGKKLKSNRGILVKNGTILVPSGSVLENRKITTLQNNGTLDATNGNLLFHHNFLLKAGGTLNAPDGDNSRFKVKGGFNIYSGSTFNHNNGTVSLIPRWNSAINIQDGPGSGRNFYNLFKSGRKEAVLYSDIEVLNDLTIVGSRGGITAKTYEIKVGGDWFAAASTSFSRNTGKVTFNGSSAQTIKSAASFYDLQISSSDVSLLKNTTVTGTLTIDSGATLDLNGFNLTAATLVNNGNLQLKGSETVSITTMDTDSGTVTYDGTGTYTQLAAGDNYFNLTLNSSSGSITLDANLDVNGSLTITDGTLNTGNNDINVAKNWTNNKNFISGTGKVTFDGDSNIITGGTGDSNDFYDVT